MGNKDTSLLLVQIHNQGEGTLSQIAQHVQGEMVNLSRLQQLTDVTKIKKVSVFEYYWVISNSNTSMCSIKLLRYFKKLTQLYNFFRQ